MVEISRSVLRRYILAFGGVDACGFGVPVASHSPVSREYLRGVWRVGGDGEVVCGCAGVCWPLALAAWSHFSRVWGSTGHLREGSAFSGGILMLLLGGRRDGVGFSFHMQDGTSTMT